MGGGKRIKLRQTPLVSAVCFRLNDDGCLRCDGGFPFFFGDKDIDVPINEEHDEPFVEEKEEVSVSEELKEKEERLKAKAKAKEALKK